MSVESAATFLPYAALIQEFRVGGQNICLGFPTQDLYEKYNLPAFGSNVGRVANRIEGGLLKLNGKEYQIYQNEGKNTCHGGKIGWHKRVFDGPKTVERNGHKALEFKLLSKDGDENFPGTVEFRVYYTIHKESDGPSAKTVLEIEYECEFIGDECEETVVNLTNHNYFNLGDCPTIEGTEGVLASDLYLAVDSAGIPTGAIERYTDVEVTKPFYLGETSPDIDNTFVMTTNPEVPIDTRSLPLKLNAAFKHVRTGINLEVHSTEPAFQIYTGKYIDIPAVGGAPARGPRAAFCVEPHRFVNAANVPEWRNQVLLKRGQTYGSKIVYKAWKA
ncbi:hypothetical protein KEM56_001942 [Ascosphaera pollenicola]|nr:hypothetical protein KEM56_001942 [Ascosphaera pollenicola]